jgi:hypothetical protein
LSALRGGRLIALRQECEHVNRVAQKCDHCRRGFIPTKIDQKYCSSKCRQAAYRKRKQTQTARELKKETQPLLIAICWHCEGTFWAKTQRALFCSTSCRTLYHRALKAALPYALMSLYGLPETKAYDIVETQPIRKLRSLLDGAGYAYCHSERRWIANQNCT